MPRARVVALGLVLCLAGCDSLFGPSSTGPSITAIAPSPLAAGDTATISGSGFSATPSANHVTVNDVSAEILAATASRLTVVVPGPEAFPCGPTTHATVVVAVNGSQASVDHPAAGPVRRTLAPGESVSIHPAGAACTELTEAGTYVVSVFNTSAAPAGVTGFRLRGATTAGAGDGAAVVQGHGHDAPRRDATLHPDPSAEAHAWLLEANARLARELAARTGPPARMDGAALLASPVEVGTIRSFRIPDLDGAGSLCSTFKTVTARAVFAGATAVIWEDTTAPLAGQMASTWQAVGQEYEEVMDPIVREYFGDPLAFDPWLPNPGRVNMLFSKQVNDFERGVAGFVFSGDLFTATQCPASDGSAIFYGRVPTVAGAGYDGNTVARWARGIRSTIIHEVKHIVSYAERMRLAAEANRPPVFEASWLEESTARLAEEYFGRALAGYGQGDNVTYAESVWCEVRISGACEAMPAMMVKHFEALYRYYQQVESLSAIGPATPADWTFYGSGWLLVRWAIDHSGTPEAAFSRALVLEPQLTGVDNLAARAGLPFPRMFGDFTLAMAMDEHPSGVATRPELRFPGWNTRDIMNGLHQDFQTDFSQPWPLRTHAVGSGDFDLAITGIRGGTAAFFTLGAGAGGATTIQLVSPGGSTAAPGLGLAIVRVD